MGSGNRALLAARGAARQAPTARQPMRVSSGLHPCSLVSAKGRDLGSATSDGRKEEELGNNTGCSWMRSYPSLRASGSKLGDSKGVADAPRGGTRV